MSSVAAVIKGANLSDISETLKRIADVDDCVILIRGGGNRDIQTTIVRGAFGNQVSILTGKEGEAAWIGQDEGGAKNVVVLTPEFLQLLESPLVIPAMLTTEQAFKFKNANGVETEIPKGEYITLLTRLLFIIYNICFFCCGFEYRFYMYMSRVLLVGCIRIFLDNPITADPCEMLGASIRMYFEEARPDWNTNELNNFQMVGYRILLSDDLLLDRYIYLESSMRDIFVCVFSVAYGIKFCRL